jgi:hypothetical protein
MQRNRNARALSFWLHCHIPANDAPAADRPFLLKQPLESGKVNHVDVTVLVGIVILTFRAQCPGELGRRHATCEDEVVNEVDVPVAV